MKPDVLKRVLRRWQKLKHRRPFRRHCRARDWR